MQPREKQRNDLTMDFHAQQHIGGINEPYGHDPVSEDNEVKRSNGNWNEKMKELRSFAQDTTLHGARFLFADNIFRRLLWTGVVIACFGHCCQQVFTCVSEFNKRPFNTKITTNTSTEDGVLFPAVTLCNLNSLNTRRYVQMMSRYENRTIIARKLRDISLLSRRSKEISSKDFQNRNPGLFLRPSTAYSTKHLQGNFSHQIKEMFLPQSPQFDSCSFKGERCDGKNFSSYKSFMFGNCYTFNSAEDGKSPHQATMAGQYSGLKLLLNIERESYLKNPLNPSVGLVILIHDRKTFPIVEEFGIKVQPGVSTLCAIKRRKIINLETPYATNCTKRSLAVFNRDSYTAYTKAACLLNCRNEYTIETCGCTPVEFKAQPSVPICAPNDTVLCVYRSYEEFGTSSKKNECERDCPEPCEYEEYKTSFSYSGLQRDVLIEHLMSLLNGTEKLSVDRAIYEPLLNMSRAEREKYIDDNIVSLDIYFEDLSYDVIEQTPLYETWALIGNLGGTFGFFLGMSLITLLEFLDFTFRRILNLFQPKRNKRVITTDN